MEEKEEGDEDTGRKAEKGRVRERQREEERQRETASRGLSRAGSPGQGKVSSKLDHNCHFCGSQLVK